MRHSHEDTAELTFAEALAEAAAVVNSSLHVERVLDRILEQVARVVPGDTYNIMLIEGDQGRILRWRGYDHLGIPETDIGRTPTDIRRYPTFRAMMETGEPVVIDDTAVHEDWIQELGRVDHCAYVGAPIRIAGRTEGFLNINSSKVGQFSDQDAQRLRAFADHAAIALRNARLYQASRRYAEELEHRVLMRTLELEARTAWSEAILRSTSDGIIVTDSAGEIIQMNPVARHWLEEELSPEDAKVLQDAIRAIASDAASQSEQLVELTGIDLELRAAPVLASELTSSAVVVAAHDVSHLRALDRMKSQFISDVSHELRTPIAAIQLYTSLLRKSAPDRREGYFTSLQEETDRISRLVEGILQVSRIEAGRLELTKRPMDLNLLASTVASAYADAAKAKGLELLCQVPSTPLPVYVDPHWFIQAIDKLLSNALAYTDAGEITLSTGSRKLDEKLWGWLAVDDTGVGIPAKEQPRLFERFFRGEQARTRQVPGSGLGLAIARGVVELHGGRILFDDKEGNGACFTILIQLAPPRE
ncbi:MAG: ATP-binding protein [Anaerolineae bacterium]